MKFAPPKLEQVMIEDHKNFTNLLKVTSAIIQCYALPSWHSKLKPRLSKPTVDIPLDIGVMDAGAVITSLVSVRKMHDFLKNDRVNSDDLICSDFGASSTELLSLEMRTDINKSIAHITSLNEGDHNRDLWEIYKLVHPKLNILLDELADYFASERCAEIEIGLVKGHIAILYTEIEAAVASS